MAVAILLVTHGQLGSNLLDTMREMMAGQLSLPTEILEVRTVQDPEALIRQGQRLLERLDTGAGVLALTDAYGSTPSNIANQIAKTHHCRVVSGVNMPMLIKLYNYPDLDLENMAQAAVEGGQRGIVLCRSGAKRHA